MQLFELKMMFLFIVLFGPLKVRCYPVMEELVLQREIPRFHPLFQEGFVQNTGHPEQKVCPILKNLTNVDAFMNEKIISQGYTNDILDSMQMNLASCMCSPSQSLKKITGHG